MLDASCDVTERARQPVLPAAVCLVRLLLEVLQALMVIGAADGELPARFDGREVAEEGNDVVREFHLLESFRGRSPGGMGSVSLVVSAAVEIGGRMDSVQDMHSFELIGGIQIETAYASAVSKEKNASDSGRAGAMP